MISRLMMLWRKPWQKWNHFFFEPTSPATIGLFRIAYGLVVLVSLIGKIPDRNIFYSENGLVTLKMLNIAFSESKIALFILHLLPTGDPGLLWFFIALVFFTLLLVLGVFTRLSAFVVFMGLLILSDHNVFGSNAGDEIIRINCFFLMFSEAGAAFSLDRWWRVRRGRETTSDMKSLPLKSPWAWRVLQLQAAYIYLDTVFLKLHGAAWLDGTAVYYALNYSELKRFEFSWFFYYLWQIKLATWGTLLIETSMFTLIWFRKFRYWVLLAALILHVGINLTMQLPDFQYAMIASLILFVDPKDIENLLARLRSRDVRRA